MTSSGVDGRPPGPRRELGRPPEQRGDPGLPVLPRPGEAIGFTLARLAAVVTLAIGADRLLGLSDAKGWTVLAVATVWVLVPAARPIPALAAVGVAWLMGTGFFSNRQGELSFGLRDREHLAVMVFAAVVAVLVSRRAAAVARSGKGRES